MSWLDEDSPLEDGKFKKNHRNPRKFIKHMNDDSIENNADYRRKRAGKRSHRKKNHKDDFWEEALTIRY